MKTQKLFHVLLAVVTLFSLLTPTLALAAPAADTSSMTIVQIASGDSRFSTLVAAVKAAGLVDALSGPGPFTVFAPTNAAFAKLGTATINSLLANPDQLKSILLYHVVGQKIAASDVVKLPFVTTLNGADAVISVKGANAYIDNAMIVITDIMASNGVIHVIDTVILPPSKDIVDTAVSAGQFNTLVTAVKAAGLVDTLKSKGPFTVFAPTDAAFAKLGTATINSLLANPDQLKNVLLYHVAAQKVYSSQVASTPYLTMANGAPASLALNNFKPYINNVMLTTTDILATNGVIHVIDAVLLPASKDIVDTAVSAGQFNTLVAAVKAAGLVDTLKGAGPFTVFAPTDAAFAKLGTATTNSLLANPAQLKGILFYHVASGKLYSNNIAASPFVSMLNGGEALITVRNNQGYINNARFASTDILATNGIIHVIDAVLLPPSKDIVDTAVSAGQFTTLVAAVKAAGLVDALKGPGPYTVFAPTDAAFAKLGTATINSLLANPDKLKSILLYHVVPGKVYSFQVPFGASATTLNGAPVQFSIKNGQPYVDNARIVTTDIQATNGVIHVIDTVILPPQ
jgi:transforming growth factor-beta-induced protein